MRDANWLHQLLDNTWDKHFSDVPQDNIVRVQFGRKAKTRLGSIKMDGRDREVTIITLNGLFKDPAIPEFVVLATLVHELTHYAHGFHSPHRRKFNFPHAGGVMRREFAERGLLQLYLDQKHWLKQYWPGVVAQNFAPRRSRRQASVPKPFWFR